jgi:hypothetical protein
MQHNDSGNKDQYITPIAIYGKTEQNIIMGHDMAWQDMLTMTNVQIRSMPSYVDPSFIDVIIGFIMILLSGCITISGFKRHKSKAIPVTGRGGL